MLGPFHNAPRAATLVTLGLLALSAIVAISSGTPKRADAESSCSGGLATCGGATYEKLICDDPIKLTKCFDAKTTCHSWDVCNCCSPIPLHKCLSPLAGRAFDSDCSSPVDAREQCCGNSETHIREFQALTDIAQSAADLEQQVEGAVSTAVTSAEEAARSGADAVQGAARSGADAVQGAVESVTG